MRAHACGMGLDYMEYMLQGDLRRGGEGVPKCMSDEKEREKGKSEYDTIIIYLRQKKADFRDCFRSGHGTGGG